MTNVYWLKQTVSDVPSEDDWLSPSEAMCLQAMRFAKRRRDWRLGRWTAKHAVALCLDLPRDLQALSDIEIRAAASGAPEIFVLRKPAVVTISLSHCDGSSLCAVARCGASLGCDLELIEPRSDAFLADYFTAEEQALVAQAFATERPLIVSLLWSAKESALKALHTGLRLDTRSVIVTLYATFPYRDQEFDDCAEGSTCPSSSSIIPNNWSRLQVHSDNGRVFHGWWQLADHYVQTIVAASPLAQPLRLVPTDLHSRSVNDQPQADAQIKPAAIPA